MAATDRKTKVIVQEMQSITEKLLSALEEFEVIKAQVNATGADFNTEEMDAIYATTPGLEHVTGDVVNAVFSGFQGLLDYIDAVNPETQVSLFRRHPFNKFRTGAS